MKNKPNIGLYLAAQPKSGGIYQYAMSLITALSSYNDIDITFFVESREWKKYIPNTYQVLVSKQNVIERAVGRITRHISKVIHNKYSYVFNNSIKLINNSNCELVLYPAEDSLSYLANKPALTSVHDLMHRYENQFSEYQGSIYDRRESRYQFICQKAEGILVDSKLGKEQIEESYQVEPYKIFVLPFVAPIFLRQSSFVDVVKKYQLPDEFIFYPAQFWEHKNHSSLIEALRILKFSGRRMHAVFVGASKNNLKKVVNQIDEANLKRDISILGYVPQDEMYSFYKQANMMVYPSLIGPTNIPPLEAMTLGCPSIVSNVYAMPQLVGEGAILVDARNPNEIADKMMELLLNKELRNRIIEKGYSQVEKWNQSQFDQRLKEIILAILYKAKEQYE